MGIWRIDRINVIALRGPYGPSRRLGHGAIWPEPFNSPNPYDALNLDAKGLRHKGDDRGSTLVPARPQHRRIIRFQ